MTDVEVLMERSDLVLAAMASGGFDQFSPVQVQKMFFLFDQNLKRQTKGPHFKFVPYDYGPFDPAVYWEIDKLSNDGLATVNGAGSSRRYALTEGGYTKGQAVLKDLPEPAQQYMTAVSEFVRSLSFPALVSAIYKAYPQMRKNSVFRG